MFNICVWDLMCIEGCFWLCKVYFEEEIVVDFLSYIDDVIVEGVFLICVGIGLVECVIIYVFVYFFFGEIEDIG